MQPVTQVKGVLQTFDLLAKDTKNHLGTVDSYLEAVHIANAMIQMDNFPVGHRFTYRVKKGESMEGSVTWLGILTLIENAWLVARIRIQRMADSPIKVTTQVELLSTVGGQSEYLPITGWDEFTELYLDVLAANFPVHRLTYIWERYLKNRKSIKPDVDKTREAITLGLDVIEYRLETTY